MRRATTATIAVCLTVTLADPANARAQISQATNQFTLAVGVANSARLDATISPMAFEGHGFHGAFGYAHLGRRYAFGADLDGTSHELDAGALPGPSEQLTRGDLRLTLVRSLGKATSTRGLSAGLDLHSLGSVTQHHYNDPLASSGSFMFVASMLGPAIAWSGSVGSTALRVALSTPAVGVVAHSYSDMKAVRVLAPARFASLSTLRGASGAITVATSPRHRVGCAARYTLSVLRYDDVESLRLLSQTVSLGIVTRFGFQ